MLYIGLAVRSCRNQSHTVSCLAHISKPSNVFAIDTNQTGTQTRRAAAMSTLLGTADIRPSGSFEEDAVTKAFAKFTTITFMIAALLVASTSPLRADWGDAEISNWAGPWPIVIRTCWWDAGAICSLNWRDREFIDDYDHGRQMQSAVKFDGVGENFNPTEAGAEYTIDGINPHPSSSQLLGMWTTSNALATATNMAFWRHVNGQIVSNHMLYKQVTIGLPGMAHVIEYLTTFAMPAGEVHSQAQYEIVTGYMPGSFSKFWTFDVRNGATEVVELPDIQGIQSLPIIFSTPDEGWAMGIYSPDIQLYGAWRHSAQNVVQWNNWVEIANPSGNYSFRSYVIVGSLENVKVSMQQLFNAIG